MMLGGKLLWSRTEMRRKRWSRLVQGSFGGELCGWDPGGDGLGHTVITASKAVASKANP